jgi:predicted ATPase
MIPCTCQDGHAIKRIALTGGPGGGKTAVLALVRKYFCRHLHVLPEAASILFGGGFPRGQRREEQQAVQRAIFHVQRELEAFHGTAREAAILLCDRGTPDGAAYWPGPEPLWQAVGTSRDRELQRYDAVIHLRTPTAEGGYDHSNPVRTEAADEAEALDQRVLEAWAGHPRRLIIASTADFIDKARTALDFLRAELPPCCRGHRVPGEPEGRDDGPASACEVA